MLSIQGVISFTVSTYFRRIVVEIEAAGPQNTNFPPKYAKKHSNWKKIAPRQAL